MEDKYRINISKLRCRYNHLPISRKYSFNYDCDIKCKLRLQNDIGDEYHYLIRCNYFLHERQLFINKHYIQHPSIHKFIQLMQTENSTNRLNLARFITIILSKLKNTWKHCYSYYYATSHEYPQKVKPLYTVFV